MLSNLNTINQLSITQWLWFSTALVLLLGVGLGGLSRFSLWANLDLTQKVTLAFCVTMSLWPVVLAWVKFSHVILDWRLLTLAGLGGWALAILRFWQTPHQTVKFSIARLFLWLTVQITFLIGLWSVRDLLVGLGSDSYHHTLISEMILRQGGLPENFQPYAPTVTFTYHYGFHAFTAAMAFLSGWPTTLLVLVLGHVLRALIALTVALLTEYLTENQWAGVVAALITGLISVFPTYSLTWGRYTQLTGLTLLPAFLWLIWQALEARPNRFPWQQIVLPSLFLSGVALAHYRVTFMAGAGLLSIFISIGLRHRATLLAQSRNNIPLSLLALGSLTLAFTLPWVMNLLTFSIHGFAPERAEVTAGAFSLSRLGLRVLDYPNNYVLVAITCLGAAFSVYWRSWKISTIVGWLAVLWGLSEPRIASELMDRVSVVISLFIPMAIIIGWLVVTVVEKLAYQNWLRGGVVLFLAILMLRGGLASATVVSQKDDVFVFPADVKAMEWIKVNTPSTAKFMVNTYHFEFLPTLIIGIDAGYWLPLLTDRQTVTWPMVAFSERFSQPNPLADLISLDKQNADLASAEGVNLLRQIKVDYVYIGQRGGAISVSALHTSPDFDLVYEDDDVFVFHLKSSK